MADGVAIWAAFVSTSLAAIRFYEFWSSRTKLEFSFSFDSRAEEGNKIIIINPTNNTVMIDFYELFWSMPKDLKKVGHEGFNLTDYEPSEITIGPYSRFSLIFKGENHFSWGQRKENLYIKLHVSGKKWPKVQMIYESKD